MSYSQMRFSESRPLVSSAHLVTIYVCLASCVRHRYSRWERDEKRPLHTVHTCSSKILLGADLKKIILSRRNCLDHTLEHL